MIEHIVSSEENDYRADKIVLAVFGDVSYVFLQKIFRLKRIKVNGKAVKASEHLRSGDIIKIYANKEAPKSCNFASDNQSLQKNNESEIKSKLMTVKLSSRFRKMIIFENEKFLAINKPSGLAVQKGSKIKVCVETLMEAFQDENNKKNSKLDLKLVHRIDKDTSGILLIAKNRSSAQFLTRLFRENKIQKTYIAIVTGTPKKSHGIIDNFLQKKIVSNEEKMCVSDFDTGLRAITEYFLCHQSGKIDHQNFLKKFPNCALLELHPKTGRKHQLRVHCADVLKTPILGDKKYGFRSSSQQNIDSNKLFLHAYKLKIKELNIEIKAELPEYFPQLLTKSDKKNSEKSKVNQ